MTEPKKLYKLDWLVRPIDRGEDAIKNDSYEVMGLREATEQEIINAALNIDGLLHRLKVSEKTMNQLGWVRADEIKKEILNSIKRNFDDLIRGYASHKERYHIAANELWEEIQYIIYYSGKPKEVWNTRLYKIELEPEQGDGK